MKYSKQINFFLEGERPTLKTRSTKRTYHKQRFALKTREVFLKIRPLVSIRCFPQGQIRQSPFHRTKM